MRVIKQGNTKRQCICEYCGAVIEYDVKEDIPASGIEWFKFRCPTCDNDIIPNTKTDLHKVINSLAHQEMIKELNKFYNVILEYIKSRDLSGIEASTVNSLFNIISREIDELGERYGNN